MWPVSSISFCLPLAWKPASGCLPGRALKAIYVRLCVSEPASVLVCLLQEKTDRLAPGNMEYVVCGCIS